MRKLIRLIIIICALFVVTACSDEEERSFSIDQVAIDAQIDAEGMIYVRELYTYTFDGSFQGMTRSVDSDAKDFQAYLLDHEEVDPTIDTKGLEDLTIEKDESTWKIHTASQNETKQVLYSYVVEGSIKKYQDIGEFTYAFFDESNETDLHDIKISIHTPENLLTEDTHFFLHDQNGGELSKRDQAIVYTNQQLEAGADSEVSIIFPASELHEMKITKDEPMKEEILTAEFDLLERGKNLDENIAKIVPMIWVLIGLVIIGGVFIWLKHPNRDHKQLGIDELTDQLERMDPLFVSYLHQHGYLNENNVIAALISLKQRNIVAFKEVTSTHDESSTTLRFTWKDHEENVDFADSFLKEWLFTEKDKEGSYFFLESILDDEDESDDKREEEGEKFQENYSNWSQLVEGREEYQNLKRPFNVYPKISAILTFITYTLFYYVTKVDVISANEQIALPLILAVFAVSCLIFSKHKWLLLFYYPALIIMSLIAFTLIKGIVLMIILFFICFMTLLMIPAKYWKADILHMKHVIKQSIKRMKLSEYPAGTNPQQIERRLEYAVVLHQGKQFVQQLGEDIEILNKLEYPLLSNPNIATETLHVGNLIFISAYMTSTTGGSVGASPPSSTGGGGAGAF